MGCPDIYGTCFYVAVYEWSDGLFHVRSYDNVLPHVNTSNGFVHIVSYDLVCHVMLFLCLGCSNEILHLPHSFYKPYRYFRFMIIA